MEDKFQIFKKWFWIGMVVALFNLVGGLVFGIALLVEREHRKAGLIIVIWSVVAYILLFLLGQWLQAKGIIPTVIVVPRGQIQYPLTP